MEATADASRDRNLAKSSVMKSSTGLSCFLDDFPDLEGFLLPWIFAIDSFRAIVAFLAPEDVWAT
jgi:hypothetical protein